MQLSREDNIILQFDRNFLSDERFEEGKEDLDSPKNGKRTVFKLVRVHNVCDKTMDYGNEDLPWLLSQSPVLERSH